MPKKVIETSHLIESVKEKPVNYPICIRMDCERRDLCLHALETTRERMMCPIITCVNPLICSKEDDCRQFRHKDAKTMYAFGMRSIVRAMKREELYKAFKSACMRHFCRTVYYDMLAGHRIIYPQEQKVILDCAAGLGIQLPPDSFDQMVEATGR